MSVTVIPGKICSDVFDQDEEWVTATGEVVRVSEITESHRLNLIRFLERNAFRLHFHYCFDHLGDGMSLQGDMAQFLVERDFERLNEMNPLEWVRSTPLYRRLQKVRGRRAA